MLRLAKGDYIGAYPYRIIKELGEGEGGMSIVYLASMGEVDEAREAELVALKIANVERDYRQFYKDTLDNETEHLRKLAHPGIVELHKVRTPVSLPNPIYSARSALPDKPWFSVMEYLSGGSLAELLKQKKKLEPGLALLIAHRLAWTLEYVHRQGYVHLDIKPENVVFRQPIIDYETIDPVLIDFGIARAVGQGGLEAGTLLWLPPERVLFLNNELLSSEMMSKPEPSMDIYPLGLLLYRMLTGKLPFQGSRKKITEAILEGNPTRPSTYNQSLTPELDQLILSAIAKKPADRPTAADLVRELKALMKRPEHMVYDVPLPREKNRGVFTFFMSFVLTLLLGLGAFLYVQPPDFLKNLLVTPTMTPTMTATITPAATEAPPTATTAPAATAIPSSPVPLTAEPTFTATTQPTSTPVPTFTPVPQTPSTSIPATEAPPALTPGQ